MPFEFKLPDIGEGVVEGEVVKWMVAEGDAIAMDQPMVEVMTDKATVEIPAPAKGKVARLMVAEGGLCKVGQVLIVIDDGSAAKVAAPAHAPVGNGAPMHMATAMAANVPATLSVTTAAPSAKVAAIVVARPGGRVLATPRTRKIARELGVDLAAVPPTGKGGRVTTADVQGWRGAAASVAAMPGRELVSIAPGPSEERVPFRGMRKAIAANMTRSKFTATHFTYVEEVDVTDLVGMRAGVKAMAAERGVKLSYLPFILKAVVAGLKKWPAINCSLDEVKQEIVYKKYYHLGIATQGPQGLSVGVVRDADRRSIFEVAREIERISAAIKDGKASREDLTGSTFTVSSLGQLGGLLATPIINFPESAIMGVHKIVERPVVREGQIVARHMMNLSISTDHRIADGYDAAMFLQEVKSLLESPAMLFLEAS
ncbi:MAG: 2-oxo acid dehydrogenase subunit E2 [Myxococcales bacterium]|nr:2-oxo acid dehydrogenase subunit E2 [Myxococcales bacterium]